MAAVTSSAENLAVHGEAWPPGTRDFCAPRQQRIEPAHFLFEQPGRGGLQLRFQRITAYQLRQAAGLVRRVVRRRAHLLERRPASRGALSATPPRLPASPPPMM